MKIEFNAPDLTGLFKILSMFRVFGWFVGYTCVAQEFVQRNAYRGDSTKLEVIEILTTFFGVEIEREKWYRDGDYSWNRDKWFNSDGIELVNEKITAAVKRFKDAREREQEIIRRKELISNIGKGSD